MNPFDIYFARSAVVVLTPEEKAAAKKAARKTREAELAAAAYGKGSEAAVRPRKRGANPQYQKRKDDVVAPAPEGAVATPRTRNWKTGEYKPGVQMRDAVDRARAEQPALMSITSKEKRDGTETK